MSLGTKMVLHSLFKFKTRRSLPFMGSPKTISILLVVMKELQGIMMVLNYDGVKKVYVGLAQDGIPVVKFVYHKGAVEIIGTEHGKSTLLGFEEVLISMELVDYYCKEAAQPWNPKEEVQFSNYGNQPQLISDIKPWLEVGEVNGLPYILEEKYKTAKTVLLGVFPEIRGTWAILDHSLTVWTYRTINVPIYYFPLDDKPVLAVGLVKPRPGFVEDAQYLLMYATTLELHLSKVCCAEDGQHIKALVDYTTSLEGLTVTCILGTDGGRIFLAGQDCHMYELFYAIDEPCRLVCCTQNAPSNFFSRFKLGAVDDPVVEMVFDSQRKTLYTRTKKAKLEAYFLGMNGDCPIEKVGEVWNLYYAPSVVSISPLSKLESKWSHAHLVALLSDGSRRYFSTSSSGNGWKGSPDCLRFITTKPPPTTDVSVDMKGELAYCSGGTLFLSLPSPDHISSTSVIVVAKDSSSRTKVGGTSTLRELGCTIRINGRMLFAAEVLPTPDATSTMLSLYSQVLGESYENTCVILRGRGDLLTQHLLPKKNIFVVSTTAMAELFFNRPVDILYSILNSSKMSRVSLNAFVDHFGADETAAMLLMLASGIMFGAGELDSLVSTRAADLFEGMKMEIMPQLDATMVQDEISHSAAHIGLYLCTSRLLYPIWNSCLLSKSSSSDSMSEDGVLSCRFSTEAMHELQRKLRSLGNYLTRNNDAQDSSGGEVANVRQGLSDGHYNVSKDVRSMECCRHLIKRSEEALFLLQILSRHDIAIFTRGCEESLRRTLLQLEFRQLVHPVEDNQIAKVLMSAIMERNPFGDDSTRDILLGGCPSYSNEAFLSPRDCTVGISSQQVIRKRVNTGKV